MMKEHLRKYFENVETEVSFLLDYASNYLHVADQRSKLSRSTWEKGYKSSQQKNKSERFSEDFLAEIDVAFKKSDILCAFEVLTVDNLNKQQSNLVNLFETSIRVLANFNGTEIEG